MNQDWVAITVIVAVIPARIPDILTFFTAKGQLLSKIMYLLIEVKFNEFKSFKNYSSS